MQMGTDGLLTRNKPRLCMCALNNTNPLSIPLRKKWCLWFKNWDGLALHTAESQWLLCEAYRVSLSFHSLSGKLSSHCLVIYVCVLVFLTSLWIGPDLLMSVLQTDRVESPGEGNDQESGFLGCVPQCWADHVCDGFQCLIFCSEVWSYNQLRLFFLSFSLSLSAAEPRVFILNYIPHL